jgi:hypothetical protein
MTHLGWARRAGAAAAALGLAVATATPAWALVAQTGKAGKAQKDCTEYGEVVDTPAGVIPRDDLITVRKDPLKAWAAANPRKAARSAKAAVTTTVPVAFHVINKGTKKQQGNVPRVQIEAQIDVLDEAFASSGFDFELVEVTRTNQPQWFNLIPANGAEPRLFRGSGKEVKMKKALHQGDARTLNIYTASLGQFLLGWAYLPWDFTDAVSKPLPRFYDGVVLDYRSLPGGAFVNYGEGDTGTHEVGHWLGLFHTFDNGCESPGDFVDDTPYEASPAFQCPIGRDTCEQPGEDPIHNFMDYTYDSCMFEFTPDQDTRMKQVWTAYRAAG